MSIVSPLQRWDHQMRYSAAVAMAVTEDQVRATGPPSILQNKTTPRSYLIGNATLQVYVESASEPPPSLLVCK